MIFVRLIVMYSGMQVVCVQLVLQRVALNLESALPLQQFRLAEDCRALDIREAFVMDIHALVVLVAVGLVQLRHAVLRLLQQVHVLQVACIRRANLRLQLHQLRRVVLNRLQGLRHVNRPRVVLQARVLVLEQFTAG